MIRYEILREGKTLEHVAFVFADSLAEAKEKARQLGYGGEGYRIEEDFEEWIY